MHHLRRQDCRGMLSLPEALWLHERAAPEPMPPRQRPAPVRAA